MFVLLFVYGIVQSGFSGAVPLPPIELRDLSMDSGGESPSIQTRSLWNIIWSCVSTIFLCTWVSLHPNISSTQTIKPDLGWFEKWIRHPLIRFLTYKLPLFLWALLLPEYIVAWAVKQYIMAGKVQQKVPGWTRAHGFFLIMGGFQLFERPDPPSPSTLVREKNDHTTHAVGKFVRILEFKDVLQHKLETIIPFVTEEEIKDRGKSDRISKIIVLFQTSWFIIQCMARGFQHLPLTELEILTLAYAMLNLFVYIFWWDKPNDVGCPIRVYESLKTSHPAERSGTGPDNRMMQKVLTYVLGRQDKYLGLSQERKVPMFWAGGVENRDPGTVAFIPAAVGPSVLGIGFGAMHSLAWFYDFPSRAELVLWRLSCVALVVIPFLSTMACANAATGFPLERILWLLIIFVILLGLFCGLYVVARIATIIIAFTTLRSLPSEAFVVVNWTTFIPHI